MAYFLRISRPNTYVWKVRKKTDNLQEEEVTSNTFYKDGIPILEDHEAANLFAAITRKSVT